MADNNKFTREVLDRVIEQIDEVRDMKLGESEQLSTDIKEQATNEGKMVMATIQITFQEPSEEMLEKMKEQEKRMREAQLRSGNMPVGAAGMRLGALG